MGVDAQRLSAAKLARAAVKGVLRRAAPAFGELRRGGYQCRNNFVDCSRRGAAELARIEQFAGIPYRGMVYWRQDTAGPLPGAGRLRVGFCASSTDASPREKRVVGEAVALAMRRQGLRVEWDGDPDSEMSVGID